MKSILVILNNFYPELSSLAQLYTDLCTELTKQYMVTVICAVPSYTGEVDSKYKNKWLYYEKYREVNIYRVKVSAFDKANKISRVKSIIGYFINTIRLSYRIRGIDVILTVSQPPILGGVIGVLYKKRLKCPLIYNIQDFNPEQIEAVKYSKNKYLTDVLKKIDIISCKKADCVSVVSSEMMNTLKNRFNGKKIPYCVSINNWVDEKKLIPLNYENDKVKCFRERYGFENKIVFMYSGNIGLIYDLENIVKTIVKLKDDKDILFAFVGQGNMKKRLEEIAEREEADNIVFIPYQSNDDIIYSLNSADIHFVLSAHGMKGVASPSKLYGIMAIGKPIIGVLENGMESRKIIEDSKCGYVVEPGDYEALIKAIYAVKKEYENLKIIGNRGREYYCNNLGREKSITGYHMMIKDIVGDWGND